MKIPLKEGKSLTRHLGRNIQRIREIVGMKQLALADEIGVSQQTVSRLEQSENIEEEVLANIAQGLGVTPDFIRNFNEEKAIVNIQSSYDSSVSTHHNQHYCPTINQDNSANSELYEKMLAEKDREIAYLRSLLEKQQ